MLGHLFYCRKNPNTAVVHASSVHACFCFPPLLFGYDWWESRCSQETGWGRTHESSHTEGAQCLNSLVTATLRLFLPSSMASMTSLGLHTKRSVHPWGHRQSQGSAVFNSPPKQVGFTEKHFLAEETITYCNRLMFSEVQLWRKTNLIT